MLKLLLTGFEPFLDFPINPTEDIVKDLNGKTLGNVNIIGRLLPVDFSEAAKQCLQQMDEVKPDVVLSLGLAAGRTKITPERIAINCRDGAADNQGVKLEDSYIDETGPAGYFSTLPNRVFVNRLNEKGLQAAISNSAGTYLCNNVMYSVLHKISQENLPIRAGFVHIPASHQLAIEKPSLPSWSIEDLKKAIATIVDCLD